MSQTETTLNHIVSLTTFRDKLFVATPDAVFDITDRDNPVRIFDLDAAGAMEIGKKYTMEEVHE